MNVQTAKFIGRRGIRSVLATLAAAATAVVLLPAGSAQAYYDTYTSGRLGSVSAPSTVSSRGYQFMVPTVYVYKNGAIGNYQQEVTATFELQLWTGNAWQWVDRTTSQGYTGVAANSPATMGTATLTPRYNLAARPGYYRVVYWIQWGAAAALPYWTGVVTGQRVFVPNVAGDMRCGVGSACTPYTSYLLISN